MDPNGIMQLIILVILILLSAFFSSAETALTTVNKYALRSMADSGNKRAARVLKVTENSAKLISTILIGNNIVNISASSLATTLTTRVFGSAAVGISTGILTLLILIFGEITPKTVAQLYSVKISLLYVDIIKFLMFVLTPVIWIVNKLADAIFFILRIDKNNTGAKITEDELNSLLAFCSNVVDFKDSLNLREPDFEALRKKYSVGGICAYCPEITFNGKIFCFTGESYRATRAELAAEVERLGGTFKNTVSKKTDYLIVGNAGNPCWAYSCYGRKIEDAMAVRRNGGKVQIINETDFWDAVWDSPLADTES